MLGPLSLFFALSPDGALVVSPAASQADLLTQAQAHDEAFSRDTPALPAAELSAGGRPRAFGEPEILYINFDGGVLQTGCGNDPHYDCSTLAGLFDGYVGPFDGNENQKISVLQATRKDLQDFGVRVVVERPPQDVDYTMVMYGDLGPQSFAGIAPYIDCEDRRGGDTSFTQGFAGSNTGSTVILQEAAHTWGLEHVDAEFDILNPFKAAGLNQFFNDECFPIVANTDLEPTPGVCNQIHTQFCDTAHQNSWQEMLLLFGPALADTTAPTLEIVSPPDGSSFVLPTTIPLLGDVEDDQHPQFYQVQVYNGGTLIFDDTRIGLDLLLNNPPEGDYDLRVVLTDEAGNSVEDRVGFSILPEGSELPPQPDEDDESPAGPVAPGCRSGGQPSSPWALAVFGLMLAAGRRRSAAC